MLILARSARDPAQRMALAWWSASMRSRTERAAARLARSRDAGAFRLLVERHQAVARARASRLCAHPDDVDDIVPEAFLQAFAGLARTDLDDRHAAVSDLR